MDRNDSIPDYFRDNHSRFNKAAFDVPLIPISGLLKIRRLLPAESLWHSA